MRKNKKGFTLSEVLICITIIGVVMALSVNSIKIVKESYVSLTYFAFKNLEAMISVLYAGAYAEGAEAALEDASGNKLPAMTRQCIRSNNGPIIQVLKADGEYNSYNIPFCSKRESYFDNSDGNLFCKSLASISNTVGDVDCSNLFTSDFKRNENNYNEPYIQIDDFSTAVPNFITTNGQRFYISEWTKSDSISEDFGYRLVAIDLNAKSRPNISTVSNSGTLPDVVTFMVLDNGEIFPLGVAADNYTKGGKTYQYLNARLKGYYYYDPDADPNSTYSSSTRNQTNIPPECTVGTKQICNYSVVPIQNTDNSAFYSYREAYCSSIDNSNLIYEDYCGSINKNALCPISTEDQAFDLCRVDVVKPIFRFNFQ